MGREKLYQNVDLAGSRQICATLGAGSDQRHSPCISCRCEQLVGCSFYRFGKLGSVFVPSDAFPATLLKALSSSTPWIWVFCKIHFTYFLLRPWCYNHRVKDLCTDLSAALCPALSTGVGKSNSWYLGEEVFFVFCRKGKLDSFDSLLVNRKESRQEAEPTRRTNKMQHPQEARTPCKQWSRGYSDEHQQWITLLH